MSNPTTILTGEAFGLGINDADLSKFFGSDFHMPAAWTAKDHPGSLPRRVNFDDGPVPFVVAGDHGILAVVNCVGYSKRDHRWEHRPTIQPDGTPYREDALHGWVLDLDPNPWHPFDPPLPIVNGSGSRSYLYGTLHTDRFVQTTAADEGAEPT